MGKDKDKDHEGSGLRPRSSGKGAAPIAQVGPRSDASADGEYPAEDSGFIDEDLQPMEECPASLDEMKTIADEMGPGHLNAQYEIQCQLPADMIVAIWERNTDFLRSIHESTGTKVVINPAIDDPDGTKEVVITGGLLGVYQAHMTIIRQYHEVSELQDEKNEEEEKRRAEEEAAEADRVAKAEELKAAMAALQAQLAEVEGPGGKSGKGKGKGKRK